MFEYKIPCDVFVRLAAVHHTQADEPNTFDNTLRLEGGLAISSNRKIMVIEKISKNNGPAAHFKFSDELVKQARIEAPHGGIIIISHSPDMGFAVAKTNFGFSLTENLLVTSDGLNPWGDWRNLLPEPPTSQKGVMFWSLPEMIALNQASPSGTIVFPTFINSDYPVLVRDQNDENWLGLFMPSSADRNEEPAEIPEWLK